MSINGQPISEPVTQPSSQPGNRFERSIPQLPELPRPVYARKEDLDREATTAWHDHPWYQLSYATRGVLEVETAHSRYIAPPRRAILVAPGCFHRVNSTRHTRMRSLYLSARLDLQPALAEVVANSDCEVLEITPLLRELIQAFSQMPVAYDESGEDGRLVTVLIDQLKRCQRSDFRLPWPDDPRIRQICQLLSDDPALPQRLAELVEPLGISEKTATRLFQRETGLSFRLWRQRLRLLHSLRLLERGERITDTAIDCGYQSTSAYIQAFRQQFGVTPAQFSDPDAD
ncbi:helix-turn-helix domain-containing protein [Oceanobacter mangrovi]|uniref:helix-turn-helix domain-containing protein n=1 Tax=Oceanobacter mangrovi TaxID=2862510 RepID=UPI001C8D1BD1|nr:helix-turn-helix domain-containing protein [Oceanobacter mangrovi]